MSFLCFKSNWNFQAACYSSSERKRSLLIYFRVLMLSSMHYVLHHNLPNSTHSFEEFASLMLLKAGRCITCACFLNSNSCLKPCWTVFVCECLGTEWFCLFQVWCTICPVLSECCWDVLLGHPPKPTQHLSATGVNYVFQWMAVQM